MAKRIGLMVFLAVVCIVGGAGQTALSRTHTSNNDEVGTYSSIAPPVLTPDKKTFVTRECDPFVVVVTATCLLEDESDTQFEFVSATPDFVRVSDAYRKENRALGITEGLGLVYVTPQLGDAGNHFVSLRVKACNGKVERVITFKIKVKPAMK